MIDHSLLNPTLTAAELEKGVALALAWDVASVCIISRSRNRAGRAFSLGHLPVDLCHCPQADRSQRPMNMGWFPRQ